ncbi:MAG: hypothetical protein ACKO3M_01400, partial [Rubrivivax sp.]
MTRALPDTRTIVFSHANGFPAGTYRVLFEAWQAAGWRVLALPRLGHDERFPVTSGWPRPAGPGWHAPSCCWTRP